jgi:membrane-bound serine protease (ClpP class)
MALDHHRKLAHAVGRRRRREAAAEAKGATRALGQLAVLAALLVLALAAPLRPAAAAKVAAIDIEGPIGPADAAHVRRVFGELESREIDLVVIRLDTPGGLVSSMRAIVKEILASPKPVVGFVGPKGAHAASAGTYILYASHIAAMAPATNLGAATPVRLDSGGREVPTPASESEEPDDKPNLDDKIVSDAVAYIRSLAELRGRNADWAERAVRNAASLPAGEALKLGVINLIADDLVQLLAKLDGLEVDLGDESVVLDLADREIVELEPSLHARFLGFITTPTVAYGLLMLGMVGLLIEVAAPGLFVPGVVGLVSLLMALYAFHLLPVSLVGLGIIVLGVVLMVVELTLPGFGFVGFSGILAFVLGSVFLIDTGVPGYGVSRLMIGAIAVITSSLLMAFLIWLRRLHTMPVLGGAEELVGAAATVQSWEDGEGRVSMRGTTWAARFDGPLRPGQKVRITAVDGLTVDVEPDREEASSS